MTYLLLLTFARLLARLALLLLVPFLLLFVGLAFLLGGATLALSSYLGYLPRRDV